MYKGINRHEAFNVDEVSRILKSDGYFITQQVGGKNNNDLSYKLIDGFKTAFPGHDLKRSLNLLQKRGFKIILSDEVFPELKIYYTAALVYFAKVIEWEFPDFSVDSCFENLCKLEKELQENGFIPGTGHRFIIVAKNQKFNQVCFNYSI